MPTSTKRRKKPDVRKSKQNRNVVLYVENCIPKGKVFSDSKSLEAFLKNFNRDYPRDTDAFDDNWIDVIITDIKGSISDVDGRIGR